jgi:hypothetical protein
MTGARPSARAAPRAAMAPRGRGTHRSPVPGLERRERAAAPPLPTPSPSATRDRHPLALRGRSPVHGRVAHRGAEFEPLDAHQPAAPSAPSTRSWATFLRETRLVAAPERDQTGCWRPRRRRALAPRDGRRRAAGRAPTWHGLASGDAARARTRAIRGTLAVVTRRPGSTRSSGRRPRGARAGARRAWTRWGQRRRYAARSFNDRPSRLERGDAARGGRVPRFQRGRDRAERALRFDACPDVGTCRPATSSARSAPIRRGGRRCDGAARRTRRPGGGRRWHARWPRTR